MDKKQEIEVKLKFLRNAEKTALQAHQSEKNRVTALYSQLDQLQSEKNRQIQSIGAQLVEAERESERLRVEHEIAQGLVQSMESEARRHGLMLELQAAGGPIEAADVAA